MALDDADKKFITDLLAASLKAQDEATKAHVAGVVTGAVKGIKDEQEKAAKAAADKAKADADASASGSGGAGADASRGAGKLDPEIARLKERLEAQERATKAANDAAAAEKLARENAELDGALRDQLVAQGVPADRVKFVIATMKAEGKVQRTTDKAPGLHFKRNGYEEVVPMDAGVKEWLAGPEGKTFLPPSGAQGSGGGAGNAQGANGSRAVKPTELRIPLG